MAIGQTQPIQGQPIQESQSAQPVQTQQPQTEQVSEKKSKWWLWLVIALVVIGAGIGSYFLWIK